MFIEELCKDVSFIFLKTLLEKKNKMSILENSVW